jgi:ferritin-like metal-binding protein YciE
MAKKAPKTLDELFHDTLKDIYFAEKKILSVLPKMEKAAHRSELKRAFAKHRTETEGHVNRLEKVFAAIDKKPQAKTCDAIVGITDEGAEIMKEYKASPALDAGLLAAAQAVEHYEISRYGTLIAWAGELGHDTVISLLNANLKEEKAADRKLNTLAEGKVNRRASGRSTATRSGTRRSSTSPRKAPARRAAARSSTVKRKTGSAARAKAGSKRKARRSR